jgi:hypothetical protein
VWAATARRLANPACAAEERPCPTHSGSAAS